MPALDAAATASLICKGASASPSATQSGTKFSSKRPHFRDACLRRLSGLAHSSAAVEAARSLVLVAWRTPTSANASGPRISWRYRLACCALCTAEHLCSPALLSCKRSFSHLQLVWYVEGNVWPALSRLAACAGSSTTAFKLLEKQPA